MPVKTKLVAARKVSVGIYLTSDLHRRVRLQAVADGTTMSALIEQALETLLASKAEKSHK